MNKASTQIYASTHTHGMDQFDSQNNPAELCKRFSELGAKGFVLTQHGVMSGVELYRKECKKWNLKFVPGIEIYVQMANATAHMILIAKNDKGYSTLAKVVSETNTKNGMAVLPYEKIQNYFDMNEDVIATSACIQGVLGVIIRENEIAEHKLEKILRKQSKLCDPTRYKESEEKLSEITKEYEELNRKKQETKKIAGTKFGMREKKLEKMLKSGNPSAESFQKELDAEKEEVRKATQELEQITAELKKLSTRKSAIAQEYKTLKVNAEKWEEYEKEIQEIRSSYKSEDELYEQAKKTALELNKIFGKGNFYLELQNHRIPTEKKVYPAVARIAKETGIPVIAANDIHTIDDSEDELLRRRILRSLRFGEGMEKAEVGDDQLYVKTDRELYDILCEIIDPETAEEAIDNIKNVFDSCNVEFKHDNHYPQFITSSAKTPEEILEEEAEKGIKWRFPDGFPDDRYEKRMRYELSIINSMGYANYHLVVKDYLEYGRELGAVPKRYIDRAPLDIDELRKWKEKHGWKVGFSIGPGRGSAVGSLVCYLIGITALDPIKYNLLFERFLNPERVSMPDIDSDFSNTIRQKVIEYVEHKYGKDSVCGIMTTNAQAPRGAVRIAAKYYGYEQCNDGKKFLSLADTIAKKIPKEPGVSFSREEDGKTLYESLCEEFDTPDAREILRWAKVVEGCFTAYGAHAAGIVISDGTPIKNHIPLRWNEKLNEWTTQMDMVSVEENGYLKMDFLGLRTLDIITDCLREIEKNNNIQINPLDIPLDDGNVYKQIFCEGKTNAVFQFESAGMKNMLERFQPTCFEDLIILVAMFRPGPLQYLDGVIEVKHGKKAEYLTDQLIPLIGSTYGAIVFQEQVMQIFQDLAGYTLGGADQVRRAMSKKKASVLSAERPVFIHGDESRGIKGCVANGISEEAADKLFDQMTDFAKYAFNRSHAAAYALIGYYTGWLKLHYPAEFLMAAMNWSDSDGIPGLMQEAKKLGVRILPPNVNQSLTKFTTISENEILFGMGAVKSVGQSADDIIAERKNGEFHSIEELFMRVPIKKDAATNLIKAGTFDIFNTNRKAMCESVETIKKAAKSIQTEREKLALVELKLEKADEKQAEKLMSDKEKIKRKIEDLQQDLKIVPVNEDLQERMADEKAYLGAYVTAHPMDEYPEKKITKVADLTEKDLKIYGVLRDITIKYRKSDKAPMAFCVLEDMTGEIDVCFFTKQYARLKDEIKEGAVVVIGGHVQMEERNDKEIKKFFAESITPAKKNATPLIMESNFYQFVLNDEKSFMEQYVEDDGCPFYIHDTLTGKIRTMNYTVSENLLTSNYKVSRLPA